jgi:hypothetical protein
MTRPIRLIGVLAQMTIAVLLVSTCLGQPPDNLVKITGTVSGPLGPAADPLAGVTVRIVLARNETLLGFGDTNPAGQFEISIDKTFIDEPLVIDFISPDAQHATQFVKFLSRNEGQQINKILPLDQPLPTASPAQEAAPAGQEQKPAAPPPPEKEDESMRPMDAAFKDALEKLMTFEEMFRRIQAKRTRDQFDEKIIKSVKDYLGGWTNPTTLAYGAPASSYNASLYSAVTAKLSVIQSLYEVRPPQTQCNCCQPCRPAPCRIIYRRWSRDDDDDDDD